MRRSKRGIYHSIGNVSFTVKPLSYRNINIKNTGDGYEVRMGYYGDHTFKTIKEAKNFIDKTL